MQTVNETLLAFVLLTMAGLVGCRFSEPNLSDALDGDDTAVSGAKPCTPRPWPATTYCYEGRAGYPERAYVGGICETYEPSNELPPVCDAAGTVLDWEPVWRDDSELEALQITCGLAEGCPEVLRARSLVASGASVGSRLEVTRSFVLRSGAALIQLSLTPGEAREARVYRRLASVSLALELVWTTNDVTDIFTTMPIDGGDILMSGAQSSAPQEPALAGTPRTQYFDSFVARLDYMTGQPRWVSHVFAGEFSAQGVRNGRLHLTTAVSCQPEGLTPAPFAFAPLELDLGTGRQISCRVAAGPIEEIFGPNWIGENAVYRATALQPDLGTWNHTLSTIGSSGEMFTVVGDVQGELLDSLRLADNSWLFPMSEWVRLDAETNQLSRVRPFGTPEEPYTSRFLPVIGYSNITALAASGSPLLLVETDAILSGNVEVVHDYYDQQVHTGYRSIFALQDGTWLAFGGSTFHVVDSDGNVLWSAQSGDPNFRGYLTGQILDDEHILVMASRSDPLDGVGRADIVDFYVIRHVHGGVANTQHATYGYDIYQSWIPPENPVLDGPEIEPRWMLAE
ncbi:MAG: hypothetical protein ACI81R_003368 [Bradymonadia bacterium]